MQRIEELEKRVRKLYEQENPNRSDWCDWLYEHHVFVVADIAVELAKRFQVDEELCRAAAMLHDIADIKRRRFEQGHEEETLQIARKLLSECGFSKEEIEIVVDDAIAYHSCQNGQKPQSLVGKVLATADAIAHFQSDFYEFATKSMRETMSVVEVEEWVMKKTDRDLNDKICFEEVREEIRPEFERIRSQFGNNEN